MGPRSRLAARDFYLLQCLGVDGKLRTAETSTVLRGTTPALMPGLRGIKAIAGSLACGVALTESGTENS